LVSRYEVSELAALVTEVELTRAPDHSFRWHWRRCNWPEIVSSWIAFGSLDG